MSFRVYYVEFELHLNRGFSNARVFSQSTDYMLTLKEAEEFVERQPQHVECAICTHDFADDNAYFDEVYG